MTGNIETVQREVQRKLGRCILRLQQVEKILKGLASIMSIEGEPQKLEELQRQRISSIKTKTMGQLVEKEIGELLKPMLSDRERTTDKECNLDTYQANGWFKMSHQISMSPENYEITKNSLTDLTKTRNDLVHHFLDQFDVFSISGCHRADVYLHECYLKFDAQLKTLSGWAKSIEDAHKLFHEAINSKEFENAIVHGVMPDGVVNWPISTIVDCLRNAEHDYGRDGWTLLDTAIKHTRVKEPEQIPSKYGCKTWRQVLKKSEQFETKIDVNSQNGKGQMWYRSLKNISLN